MSRTLEIFTDGACSGNPGDAAVGVVITEEGQELSKFSKFIGPATNNIAEYTALIYALQKALMLRGETLKVYTDSELLYKQLGGSYKIKNQNLKFLYDLVQHLLAGFERVEFRHVRREKNREADELASTALKKQRKAGSEEPVFLFDKENKENSQSAAE